MTERPVRVRGTLPVDDVYTVTSPVDGARDHLEVMTVHERADLCRAAAAELEARAEDVARTVAWETGRTVASGRDEVAKAAAGLRLAAEEAVRLTGAVVPVRDPAKLTMVTHHPTGPWAVLSPWNFPVNIPVEYLGPALAVGNPVVWKPAPSTAASAALLLEALVAAGVPDGAVSLLLTDRLDTAGALVRHPDVVGIGLTGSTATGRAVAAAAAGKRLILELGGNGPVIVYADADLDLAARAAAASGFAASGQICSSTGRVLVEASVADELAERIAAYAADYVLGDPFADGTVIGPVHDEVVVARLAEQLEHARAAGARVVTRPSGRRWPTPMYLEPTVVTDVPLGAALEAEESFGPVVPVVPLPDGADLVAVANRGAHALSTAVFTRDVDRALDAARRLRFGSVVVNDRSGFWELHLPFGGWEGRDSGTGRVGVPDVVRQMTQTRTTSFSRST